MPPIDAIANAAPPQPPADGGHANHGPAAGAMANGGTESTFADALTRAVGQPVVASPHGGHGGIPGASGHGGTPGGPHGGHGSDLASSSSDPHPRHFPLAGQAHGANHKFQETALGLRAYRQQLIASNIANADTPGYKAVDIDFEGALRIAQTASQTPPMTLATTASSHIHGDAVSSQLPIPALYVVPSQGSVDGNTVDMDIERSKFAENSMMYQFSLDRVSGHFKMLMELYQNLK